ncbi:TlpA disulfide reductase family protein [Aurantivibrio plasticivorans]
MKQLIALILCCTLFGSAQAAEKISGNAHDFTLSSSLGKNIRLAEERGNVVLINFWATWCGPCRQEMPHLEALYKRYNRAGFTILGVNVEPDPNESKKLLKEIPVSFPILYDTESKVSEMYGVDAMPTTVIVDRNGKMRYLHRGYKPGYEEDYRKQIRELIRE